MLPSHNPAYSWDAGRKAWANGPLEDIAEYCEPHADMGTAHIAYLTLDQEFNSGEIQ